MYRLITFIFLFGCAGIVKSQQIDYAYLDSLSYQQYLNGRWDELLQTGKLAKEANIIYPNLSLRLGYAAFMKGNHSLSLVHYEAVLKFNSFNQSAHYYITLNNLLLSRNATAVYTSQKVNESNLKTLHISQKKVVDAIDLESSIKTTNVEVRKTGQYYRLGLSNRINYKWKLHHSFSTYRQNMLAADSGLQTQKSGPPRLTVNFRNFLVSDFQYYLKSELHLNSKLMLTNAIHITRTNFDGNNYKTIILNCALKLIKPFADYKLEINAGTLLDSMLYQTAISSTYYPLGNLVFYGNSRLSFQHRSSSSQVNYSQLFGFKLNKKVWIETHILFGQIKNLIDNEAFYIYDALDVGNFRLGTSLIFPISNKIIINTNYYYEQKNLYLQNTNYNLNSLTLGLSWKL